MTRDGHVRVERSGRIELTQKGRKRADYLALRHQLAEMLLTEVIGLSWAKAHDEAEQLEHAISPEVEALLLKRFGDKKRSEERRVGKECRYRWAANHNNKKQDSKECK